MPMTFRPRKDLIGYPTSMDGIAFAEKRSIKRKYAVKFRPKSFDMARLTIGNFVARQLADAQKQNEVKVYFAKQLICYELTIDYPSKTCARPNRYSIVLSFNFEDIIGMHFTDHEVYIRLRCPPMQVFCSVQRTGDGDVGGLFPEDTSDMTFGERNTSLVHKVVLFVLRFRPQTNRRYK
uniref:Uncharacterized protein n=1 Tax=Plectus sambesii TaxID=2011161 RepID=A0A914X6S3_9BILA